VRELVELRATGHQPVSASRLTSLFAKLPRLSTRKRSPTG
jgi:hypothetical protein